MSLRTCRFEHVVTVSLILACDPGPAPAAASPPAAPDPALTGPALKILERPITDDDARRRRTIAYRQRHQDPSASDVVIEPRVIVLHHTGGGDLDRTWRYFDRPVIEATRTSVARGGELNVSAHFLVDRDGAVVRLMPETRMARHCVGLNHLAIGVENVGDGAGFPLTDAQVLADVALVRDLKRRFPGITHLIGHHEHRAFEGHAFYRELEPAERLPQEDPGPPFMRAVRAQLADLGLQGPP
ncbi:MAG: N-acetylmuramoyl-L-alanine amidase [Nannocystis sp.]|nr:peptidoglycan recognition family protein [Nannocystis sp.]MBA3550036.1 N-acetylmuramoyl-L-alanine amidase [Nannocystis sp.]